MPRASHALCRMIGPATGSGLRVLALGLLPAPPSLPATGVTHAATGALEVPWSYLGRTGALPTEIEQLRVQPARMVIDQRSGTIVMGAGVCIARARPPEAI